MADSTARSDYVARREETPLRRGITKPLLFVFVLGDILGAGIYAVAGEVAAEAGGALWAPMLVAFALAMLTAFAYAELVTKYPRASGAALYVQLAFRLPLVTFVVAVAVMASGIASASTSALAFGGDYLGVFVGVPQVLAAVAFVLVLGVINYWGIRTSTRINLALTIIEASGLLVVIAIGASALSAGAGDPGRIMAFPADSAVPVAIASGAALAFFSFIGFEDSANVAEETQQPRRIYPMALFGGLTVALIFYLLVVFAAAILVPPNQLSGSSAPLLEVVRAGAPDFPPWAFALIALFAVANTALINLIMASRLLYGLGEQRIVPGLFARVASGRQTPWVSIVVITAVAVALVSTGSISGLADTTVLLLLAVFTMVNTAVLVLRRDTIEQPHFRAPTAIPVLGAISSAGLAVYSIVDDPAVAVRAVALVAAGLALWLINRAFGGGRVSEIEAKALDT